MEATHDENAVQAEAEAEVTELEFDREALSDILAMTHRS